jgi:hypothetical protein
MLPRNNNNNQTSAASGPSFLERGIFFFLELAMAVRQTNDLA